MTPQVAMTVQFFTHRTISRDGEGRLLTPEPMGPLPALVSSVHSGERVDLIVYLPTGRTYVAKDVTTKPTTPVQHYWRPIPKE